LKWILDAEVNLGIFFDFHTAEAIEDQALAFHEIRGPHLLDDIGEANLENPAGHHLELGSEVAEHADFPTGIIVTPGNKGRPDKIKSVWQGKVPELKNLRWEGGEFAARPKTYLRKDVSRSTADSAFREQFEHEVEESVDREKTDR
jgi:hypothetical protein